jgi:para-aminobenzoate synthetase/4-amino-4-deoxychorismate lyase
MSASHPWARFDYLRTGKAFRCPTPHHILIATRPEEVSDVLRTVDEATARGSWAFGYVSYEAASGLDQSRR